MLHIKIKHWRPLSWLPTWQPVFLTHRDAKGYPECHCPSGYEDHITCIDDDHSDRCHSHCVPQCHNYCLNNGNCTYNVTNNYQPVCHCSRRYSGKKCQIDICDKCSPLHTGEPVIIATALMTITQQKIAARLIYTRKFSHLQWCCFYHVYLLFIVGYSMLYWIWEFAFSNSFSNRIKRIHIKFKYRQLEIFISLKPSLQTIEHSTQL